MPDPIPAAAAPAATPAAAPVVPPVAAPAAAPPAAPAAAPVDSLLPADDAPAPAVGDPAAPAAADPAVPPAADPVDPNSGKAWLLAEGVLGKGEKPEWLKSSKYKSAEEQAKAYPELEKRFGKFTGAPKEDYKFTAPEGLDVQIALDHPMMVEFTKWAKESQLSQEGYNGILGMFAQYEAAQMPNMAVIKSQVGENADARISAVSSWAKANLGAEGYNTLRLATSGTNAASVFKTMEALIAKTTQAKLPALRDDSTPAPADGLAAIKALQAAKDPVTGKRLYEDPKYRAMVEGKYTEYYSKA